MMLPAEFVENAFPAGAIGVFVMLAFVLEGLSWFIRFVRGVLNAGVQ